MGDDAKQPNTNGELIAANEPVIHVGTEKSWNTHEDDGGEVLPVSERMITIVSQPSQ